MDKKKWTLLVCIAVVIGAFAQVALADGTGGEEVPPVGTNTSGSAAEPTESHQWDGQLACTLRFFNPPGPHHDINVAGVPGSVTGVNACGVAEIAAPGTTGDDFLHTWTITQGLKTVVGAFVWEPSTPVGDELTLMMEVDGRPNLEPRYARVSGESPLEFRVDAGSVIAEYPPDVHEFDFENVETALTLMFRVFAGGSVNVAVQQPFTVYWDLYYDEPAPEDASALPE